MINTFLNSYFGFNRQQRNGLLLLIGISFFLLVVRLVYPYFIEPDDMIIRNINVIKAAGDSMDREKESGTTAIKTNLFKFDPNTVSYNEMIDLGFPAKTAKTLITFRTKGYKFRKDEDLLKVYGITPELFSEIKPYVVIATTSGNREASTKEKTTPVSPSKEIVELNSADSLGLLKVNGIGPTFAKRILKYREMLGGFVSVEQLKEVYGFTAEHFEKVKNNVTVNSALVHKIHINSADFKTVNRHPYISYEQTKDLFNFRQKTPLTQANIGEVLKDDVLAAKLMPYLAFD